MLTEDNRLWMCGDNHYGQLGLGDKVNRANFTALPWPADRDRVQQIIAGGYHTFVLTENNRLWVYGDNSWGQLGLRDKRHRFIFTIMPWPEERGKIRQVIAGRYHTVVLTEDNQLWVCGCNKHGQLGLGDNDNRSTFTPVQALPKAMKQFFMLNNILNQLIKLGTSLMSMPNMASGTFHSKHQSDEPEGQPPLKKMRL